MTPNPTTLPNVTDALREELVSPSDIATRLGLRSHRVVLEWRAHLDGFPSPVTRRRTYLWRWADVERWWRSRNGGPAVVEPRAMTTSHGWTAPGFEPVRDAFEANFTHHNEVGAAFCAYHRGQKVADLWGGIADPATGAAWDEDTMVLVFSTTKAFTAMCAHHLAQSGALDVEAPVRTYWPEFAAAGKNDVTVAHLLSHQAGLPWVDGEMSLADALAWDPVIRALEAQAPAWEPGTMHGYHALTYGWLVGEIVRRVSGRSVGTYLRDELAGPLGTDVFVGLPAALEARVAPLISMFPPGLRLDGEPSEGGSATTDPVAEMIRQFMGPQTVLGRALTAPGGAFRDIEVFNTPEVRAAEIPAANGVADARGVARLYAACIGEVDGIRTLTPTQLDAAITQRTSGGNHVLFEMDIQFGLGFMVRSSIMPLGGPRSFGHFGMGGSMGWADPDAELAFGYVMNKMDLGLAGDARSTGLVDAVYACL